MNYGLFDQELFQYRAPKFSKDQYREFLANECVKNVGLWMKSQLKN
jgi:hypothetical protein